MPAASIAQQRLMGMCAHTDHPASACPKMAKAKMREFARTPHAGLPRKKTKMPSLSGALADRTGGY